jgi:hypothetical protein
LTNESADLDVPNQITFLRLGFLPFFLILILYEKYQWALLVLRSAASGALDRLLARELDRSQLWAPISTPSPTNCCSALPSSCWQWKSKSAGGSPFW